MSILFVALSIPVHKSVEFKGQGPHLKAEFICFSVMLLPVAVGIEFVVKLYDVAFSLTCGEGSW